jgi:protein-export membrane protein SecD
MPRRAAAIIVTIAIAALAYWVVAPNAPLARPFSFGLDLQGGTRLTFVGDTAALPPSDVQPAMAALREVVERRVNIFGVSEPSVAVLSSSFGDPATRDRLVVELPGVTDPAEAAARIGETPVLEFKLVNEELYAATDTAAVTADDTRYFEDTGLSGADLARASLTFNPTTREPEVTVQFNDEGSRRFAEITRANVGRSMAIVLDGAVISSPVIRDEIVGGTAQISGGFTAEEAKSLARDLNYGALPVKVSLLETSSVGASLGQGTFDRGLAALAAAFALVAVYIIAWYRLPGLVAVVALIGYVALVLASFKIFGVVLTAAGIAGFVLSVGMAVDANVLIFERMREELLNGAKLPAAIDDGSARAWPSVRDGHGTSFLAALVLYLVSGTALVKGFCLVFMIGVVASLISNVFASRVLLRAFSGLSPKLARILVPGAPAANK